MAVTVNVPSVGANVFVFWSSTNTRSGWSFVLPAAASHAASIDALAAEPGTQLTADGARDAPPVGATVTVYTRDATLLLKSTTYVPAPARNASSSGPDATVPVPPRKSPFPANTPNCGRARFSPTRPVVGSSRAALIASRPGTIW